MSQHTDIALPQLTYNRTDYTALRAYCCKIPIERIADLYYSEDSPEVEQGLERFLIDMRNQLVERAIEHNPAFAEILKGARQGGQITSRALDILIKAADMPRPVPNRLQPVSQWFRPKMARTLRDEGVVTLGELVDLVKRRGPGWWRAIPRVGPGRARAILGWIRAWPQLGELTEEYWPVDTGSTLELLPLLDPTVPDPIAPLGTFQLPHYLSGVDGANRASSFCFIGARNDLEAVNVFLARYEDQKETQRSYRKELERLILWCALVARKPMSSMLVDDCLAYKTFLAAPWPAFRGPRAPRNTKRWRPFAEQPLSPASQRLAVIVLRSAFEWLFKVRYLGGNPWTAVKDPVVAKRVDPMQIERALEQDTWEKVVAILQRRANVEAQTQDRVALAALLLMGDSGLRRSEVAAARRDQLEKSRHHAGVWLLTVIGKGRKERFVPVSPRTIAALRDHWSDRNLDFDQAGATMPLLGPVVIPSTEAALGRHEDREVHGYHATSLYNLVEAALRRVRTDGSALTSGELASLTTDELVHLASSSPHAFRHTFATMVVEQGMPLELAQDILGHANITTTRVYVQARQKRIAAAAAEYFEKAATGPKGSSADTVSLDGQLSAELY
ncbi:tyrosine-type recombinase/integrase [Massilia sp.]|uniref:tyrosine-type recombinase/integrase n=1 Tax=Massilia sp. TaxID=1882437 RepID=UPI00352BF59E